MTPTVTDTMEAKAKDVASRRERLHRLVDDLLEAVETFVDVVHEPGDPVLRKLMNAPWDDEPVMPEEEEAVREAYEDIAAGRVQTLEEVEKELGL